MCAQSMEGLSARSVLINAFCQLIILLYLFDNETSFVVLLSAVLVRPLGRDRGLQACVVAGL